MVARTWWCICAPLTEVSWRFAVIARWNAQNIEWYRVGIHQLPWPVVPGARVPVVSLVGPVHAIVEERVLHSPAERNRPGSLARAAVAGTRRNLSRCVSDPQRKRLGKEH